MSPNNNLPSDLRTELSKLAKISNVQAGLPPIIRGLPVIAIVAGEVISRATNTSNIIENHMLGADEAFQLAGPSKELPVMTTGWERGLASEGVKMMCARCRPRGQMRPLASTETQIQGLLWRKRVCAGSYLNCDGPGDLSPGQSIEAMKPHDTLTTCSTSGFDVSLG